MNNDEMPSYIIDIALKIKNESWMEYEKDFRIHSYHAYSDANYWNDRLKSSGGSYMGNPTGIYAASDEPLYVFVDQGIPQNATLYISGCTGNNLISNAKSGYKFANNVRILVNGQEVEHIFDQDERELWLGHPVVCEYKAGTTDEAQTAEENPATGDNVYVYLVMFGVSALVLSSRKVLVK